ncbi:MAG: hypothetical protein AAF810_07150 [Cyanobacteria bacterium P01_D01_bin.36]
MSELQKSLVLWAESPEEARRFLHIASSRVDVLNINQIFVAKKSPRSRFNKYISGEYYITSNDQAVDVYDETITAPQGITSLVQWCTCDIMLSIGDIPCVVIEDTTHIVRMNLYQRFPRLARASSLKVPSLILQGTRGLDFQRRGDCWALYRYLQSFDAIAKIHPDCPSIPIWYEPTPEQELAAQSKSIEYITAIVTQDNERIQAQRHEVLTHIRRLLENGVRGFIPPNIPSINHDGTEVVIRIGAKPDKKSWRTKGSGQMDPYIGMILAAKYIYCYDTDGRKIKPLVVEFSYLPKDFWFFRDRQSTALYKRLPFEFADEVRFLG